MLFTNTKYFTVECFMFLFLKEKMGDSSHVVLDRFYISYFLFFLRNSISELVFWEVVTVNWFFVCSFFVPPFCFLSKINFIALFSSCRSSIFALSTLFSTAILFMCLYITRSLQAVYRLIMLL